MAEYQKIKERLIAFIAYLGIGQGKFEKECGVSNGYVNNIRKSITPEKLQQIALRYPELNTGWLMTGEGEMLKNNLVQTKHGNYSPERPYDEVFSPQRANVVQGNNTGNIRQGVGDRGKDKEIEMLKEIIKEDKEEIAFLRSLLAAKFGIEKP